MRITHKAEVNPANGASPEESDVNHDDNRTMVHNVYIVVDGVVVFHRMYGSIKRDSALVSSFLGVVASLSRDITGQGTLRSIEMPPMKIGAMQIMDSPQVLVAAATNEDFPEIAMTKILRNVADVFLDKFGEKIMTVGVKDLTVVLKDDVHKALMDGIKDAIHQKILESKGIRSVHHEET